jgi:hypothetical protein
MSCRAKIGFAIIALIVSTQISRAQPITNVSYDSPLLWTDRVGNTHPAKFLNIEWWDDDSFVGEGSSLQYLGYNPTDAAGNATFSTNEDDYGTNIEFFTRIRAAVQDVTHVKNQLGDADPYIIRFPGGTSYVAVAEGATASIGAVLLDNTTDAGTAMAITQPINYMTNYYKNTLGANVPFCAVVYNSSITGSAYTPADHLDLRYGAWGAWDVVMHEWGHHIAHSNGLDGNFGGGHSVGTNNIAFANPGPGARLAYGEALATHLALMGIKEGNLNAAIPGLPAQDLNNIYDSYQSTASTTTEAHLDFRYTLEDTSQNLARSNKGEGDEGAVGRVFWDVYDTGVNNESYQPGRSDRVSFGAQKIWDAFHGNQTFFDFWKVIENAATVDKTLVSLAAADANNNAYRTLGEVLEEYAVSGRPLTDGNVPTSTPELEFNEANFDLSGNYRWLVMDTNWNIVVDSGPVLNEAVGLSTQKWKIPNANHLAYNTSYWWVILNSSAMSQYANPGAVTNWYWSGANLLNVVPEPTTLALTSLLAIALRRRK